MQQLPNNCRAGKISVFPKNWKTTKANPKLTWYIKYRFYDDNLNLNKQVVLKGMNGFSDLSDKQAAVYTQLADEENLIVNKGYNRITGKYSVAQPEAEPEDERPEEDLTEKTPFIEALYFSLPMIKCVHNTRLDIESCLKYIRIAAALLGYDKLPVKEVRRRHLVLLLEKVGEVKLAIKKRLQAGKSKIDWTANTYNYYRAHLSMLYRPLVALEIFDANIVEGIEKAKHVKKIRETVTQEQRKTINGYLREHHYSFWRFLHIFYHSGSRIIELLQVKKSDVDLDNQRFKILVKKGRSYREEWRIIKDEVLWLWQDICSLGTSDQVLFSEGLLPGASSIRREQVTRRWLLHIKTRFGVTADFYSLKHSNTTEVMDELANDIAIAQAERAAAAMNGHTTTAMVKSIYDVQNGSRHDKQLKKVRNKFA